MREGYADEVLIVSSGEMMSLYAAHNIAQAIKNFAGRSYASLSGIILNRRNIENERALADAAAREIGAAVIGEVPRCSLVQDAEAEGKTVLEKFPASEMSGIYRALAALLAGGRAAAAAS
jgi:nitrogenase iron protein NifH